MKYFVLILAVVALTSGAALPNPRSADELTGYREEDVTEADLDESVDEISKQYGQFVPGLGYVSYYSPLWAHIKDMSAEELNTFIEGLHALHQAENEEEQVAPRRKDNAYGEYVEGLGFVNYHNPLWSIIKHFDSEELKAFVSQLHQHDHRPIPYAQEEEAVESPNYDQNVEEAADVLNVEENASNGEEAKAQNEQADEENQEEVPDEAQEDSDGAQEESRDGEDGQIDEENENQEVADENDQGEGRDGEDNSAENEEDVEAKADEDGDVAAEELHEDVDARQNENDEDNDASEAEGDNDDADVEEQAKQ